jgi:hypothetical protein
MAVCLTTPSLAVDFFFGGDTTGQPTFNRPSSLTTLSGVGTAVSYVTQDFMVTVTGAYQAEMDGVNHPDTYALVYSAPFNPATPLANLLNGDDDYSGPFAMLTGTGQGLASSRIATGETTNFAAGGLALTAGTCYTFVGTGFGNPDFGAFLAAIGQGPGDVVGTCIPEPASLGLCVLGAFLSLFAARRR